jgi:hypothetical protein
MMMTLILRANDLSGSGALSEMARSMALGFALAFYGARHVSPSRSG